jgi:spermidine/putrescine transport system permease protein
VSWLRNPWGRPRFLVAVTVLYVVWSVIPVLIAVVFSFNDGRSRSVWQGFSLRWINGDPNSSLFHDPALRGAMEQSFKLAALAMVIATPIGVALAIGLQRWRGRGGTAANVLMLIPLVTPELVMGVGLFLIFTRLFGFIGRGTWAQAIGQVTFSISYVVVIVRGRLASIGKEYEEAAADLGAPPFQVLRRVLMPLLGPAIFSSLIVVFALSIDDFVITQWLSFDQTTETVPVKIYSSARTAPLPSLNALASVMVVVTLASLALAYVVYNRFARNQGEAADIGSIGGGL